MKPSSFFLRVLGPIVAAVATAAALLVVIPEAGDYAKASVDKHRRLQSIAGPKVVFVGGSNLSYGLDSGAVDRALPHEVVNMGLNSFLGVRYLLAEVENDLRAGDIVALSFEHELFFTAPDNDFVDGSPIEQLMLIKAMPASAKYLTNWKQRVAVLKAVPSVVQIKLERMVVAALALLRGRSTGPRIGTIEWVEGSRTAFNEYGDMTRHLDARVTDIELEEGRRLDGEQLRDEPFVELARFRDAMQAKGVTVLFLPPPTPEGYYRHYQQHLDALYARLAGVFPGVQLLAQSPYVYPDEVFFDDISHLGTRDSLADRTARVIEDLRNGLSRPQSASIATEP